MITEGLVRHGMGVHINLSILRISLEWTKLGPASGKQASPCREGSEMNKKKHLVPFYQFCNKHISSRPPLTCSTAGSSPGLI